MNITRIPAFTDNYFWLLSSENNHFATIVDPGDSKPVLDTLKNEHLILESILVTHHHNDHIGGISDLKKVFPKCIVYGPDDKRIPTDICVNDNEELNLENIGAKFRVIEVPGHTSSHIAYYFDKKLFCGDTLFSCGCGRLFEGTPEQMHDSLEKIQNLPDDTLVYCAHEYTLDNIGFAKIVDPLNDLLIEKEKKVIELRDQNIPTVPSILKEEKLINPFLRYKDKVIMESVANHYKKEISNSIEVFHHTRMWKDTEYD